MNIQDPIADMLVRVKNACMASLKEVKMPASNMKTEIAKVLKAEGYISDYKLEGEGAGKTLVVEIKYFGRQPVIEGIRRVSKPSCRIYCGTKDIPRVRNGLGTVILSTPKGIVSGRNAKKDNIGGEVLCYIW